MILCAKQKEDEARSIPDNTTGSPPVETGGRLELTECMQLTVLAWVPCGVLLVLAPVYLVALYKRKTLHIPHSWLNISKTVSVKIITSYL